MVSSQKKSPMRNVSKIRSARPYIYIHTCFQLYNTLPIYVCTCNKRASSQRRSIPFLLIRSVITCADASTFVPFFPHFLPFIEIFLCFSLDFFQIRPNMTRRYYVGGSVPVISSTKTDTQVQRHLRKTNHRRHS